MNTYQKLEANRVKLGFVCWAYYTFVPFVGIYIAFRTYIRSIHQSESPALQSKRHRIVLGAMGISLALQWLWTFTQFLPSSVLLPVCTGAVYAAIVLGNWARRDPSTFAWTTLAEYIDVYAFWGLAIGFPFAYPDKIGAIAILVCASLYFSAWLSWFGRAHHKKIAGLYQLAGLAYLWILAYTEYFDGLMS